MRNTNRLITSFVTVATAVLVSALPASAQTPPGLMADLMKDLAGVEKKIMDLARAMPESAWTWRPAGDAAVRSTGEVFQHVAADNYFLPVLAGTAAPAETGITKDYKTVQVFEKKAIAREAVLADLEKSFAFLRTSMSASEAKLDASIDMFGQKSTTRGLWISTVTHLHEHLGQLIAYARSNKVVPPWSK
jgi:uncharacterized damage-inducible protein DinB